MTLGKKVQKEERDVPEVIKSDIIPIIKEQNGYIDLLSLKNKISKITYKEKLEFVRNHVTDPEIITKIETHIMNTGCEYSIEDIQTEIVNNDFECSHYIKDTGRQNVYEHLQYNILKLYFNKKIKKLPSSGNNCKYVHDGKIVNHKPDTIKSIDFEEKFNNLTIYYFGKYTKETFGGAQDNQAHDAIQFIIESNKYVNSNNDNIRFVLLADGDYYQTHQFKNTIKKYLNDKVKIHTINSINTENWL